MIALLQAIAGLCILYFGGETLVRGAVALASRFGLSSLAIGLTVVAFGTSAPELAVSLNAGLNNASDIALGNVIGSNIANLGLILGLSAVISPLLVQAKIIRLDAPIMLASVLLFAVFLVDNQIGRLEGIILSTGLIAYIAFTFIQARKEPEVIQEEFLQGVPQTRGRLSIDLGLVILGLGLLVLGGKLLVLAAVTIALQLGMSEAVIGLTIVALGTSLPELTATLVAARRGYGDIAIGNIIGSNIFNMLGILGITTLVTPLESGNILWGDILCMTLLSLLTYLFLFTRGKLERSEGVILVLIYCAYTFWLIIR
ncbi:MAG: calcium/sodium antiporter [Gammaproteobacteria bacterium]|nr:calcium/sodium antiporter [Gammaproteobacteria bacterium]